MAHTVSSLQREFGLPFATAETVVREQMAPAGKRCRIRHTLGEIVLAAAHAASITD